MSYIRCVCNPESLYVVGIEIRSGDVHDFNWTDHHGKLQQFFIPSDDFNEFFKRIKKWEELGHDWGCDTFEYKGITLKTVEFHVQLNRVLTDEEIRERDKIHMFDRDGRVNHLICLSYKDNPPLLMWEVTWDRLRNSAYDHLLWPGAFVQWVNKWLFGYQPWLWR